MTSPSRPVGTYLSDLHQSLGVGVPETSGYPALRNLLDAVGDTLNPKIAAVLHPLNAGAGLPDGGLFAARDLKKFTDDAPALETVKPERGVIEVKSLAQDIPRRAQAKEKVERKICCAGEVSRNQRGRACPATPAPRGATPDGPSGLPPTLSNPDLGSPSRHSSCE